MVPRGNSSFGYDLFILEGFMEQLSETLIWGLFVFVAVFLVNFLWIFKRGYENIKKQKTKKKNMSMVGAN